MAGSKRRPFPQILLTLLLLGVTALAVYFFVITPPVSSFMEWYIAFGEFICRYDTILIGVLLVVNLVELVDIVIFAKRDETINAVYELATSKSIGLVAMFNQYFSGITSRAPLIFAEEERGSMTPRLVVNLAVGAVKFIAWLTLFLSTVGMIVHEDVYNFAMSEGRDYAFTTLVLLCCLNVSVLAYALYRMLPLHESRSYETITYYTDGSVTREITHQSNYIAILFVAGVIYLFGTAYYIFPLSSKVVRAIETARLSPFLLETRGEECIWQFYSGE